MRPCLQLLASDQWFLEQGPQPKEIHKGSNAIVYITGSTPNWQLGVQLSRVCKTK